MAKQALSLPDFFVRLQSLTRRREDAFTECVVAALREDEGLARSFVSILAGGFRLDRVNLSSAKIGVAVQRSYSEHGCRIDMELQVGDRIRIGVEHKLLSPQSGTQVEDYSKIEGLTHFALVAARHTELNSCEMAWGTRLLRPSKGRHHFFWAEFYQLIARQGQWRKDRASTIRDALCALFDANYLQAAHRFVGYLKHPEPEEQRKHDEHFAKHLLPLTWSKLEKRGWNCAPSMKANHGSKSEIWVSNGPSKRLAGVWVYPRYSPGALRVRLYAETSAKRDSIERALRSAIIPSKRHIDFLPVAPSQRTWPAPWAIDLIVPWNELLRMARTRSSAAMALSRYVSAIVAEAS